jgi:hypothetical protein
MPAGLFWLCKSARHLGFPAPRNVIQLQKCLSDTSPEPLKFDFEPSTYPNPVHPDQESP